MHEKKQRHAVSAAMKWILAARWVTGPVGLPPPHGMVAAGQGTVLAG